MTLPEQCPRWEQCSAPICPLDQDWRVRPHLRGDPICLWLREAVKEGGEGLLRRHLPWELCQAVLRCLPEAMATVGIISMRLQRASRQGSKVRIGASLRKRGAVESRAADRGDAAQQKPESLG